MGQGYLTNFEAPTFVHFCVLYSKAHAFWAVLRSPAKSLRWVHGKLPQHPLETTRSLRTGWRTSKSSRALIPFSPFVNHPSLNRPKTAQTNQQVFGNHPERFASGRLVCFLGFEPTKLFVVFLWFSIKPQEKGPRPDVFRLFAERTLKRMGELPLVRGFTHANTHLCRLYCYIY